MSLSTVQYRSIDLLRISGTKIRKVIGWKDFDGNMNEQQPEDAEKAAKIVITTAKEECSTLENDAESPPAAKSIEDQAKNSQNDDSTIKEATKEMDAAIADNATEEVVTKEETIQSPVNNKPIESDITASGPEVVGDTDDVKKSDVGETLMEDVVANDKVIESTVTEEIESCKKSPDETSNENVEEVSMKQISEESTTNDVAATTTDDVPVNSLIPKSDESAEKISSSKDIVADPKKEKGKKKSQKGLVVTVQTNVVVPPKFVHDPNKLTLKFLFANRDGLNVICDCSPSDTVGEVKGLLLSMWPDGKSFKVSFTPFFTEEIMIYLVCI